MGAAMVAAGASALNAVGSFSAGRKAKKAAQKEARLQRLMTAEELRRLEKEQSQVLGSARAQIAGSGFTGYGASSEAYLDELQSSQSAQQTFTAQVGAERASAIRTRGNAVASSYKMGALSSLISAGGSVGESFNWGLDETT